MRNMSFSMTTEQIRSGTKTVTRRLGWKFLKPGDVVMACEKCQGLKKGERTKKIRPIRIVSVRREPLSRIIQGINGCFQSWLEVKKEGFPGGCLDAEDFISLFCIVNKCQIFTMVTRIEFEYAEEP